MIEDVRGTIMTVTLELLKKKDYKDVQMKEITETANIGRRTSEEMAKIIVGIVNRDFPGI